MFVEFDYMIGTRSPTRNSMSCLLTCTGTFFPVLLVRDVSVLALFSRLECICEVFLTLCQRWWVVGSRPL
jgi:hypothetical protein